jgi:predicted SAM-dependent methyltransferase
MDCNELKNYAKNYIKGSGIEIGALHNPMPVNSNVKVKYVDRLPKETLRQHYPELTTPLIDIDVLDDGEKLKAFDNDSLDFIIANNFLEHCKDPIGTIDTHIRKLKTNGILYYVVPDKRFTFDKERVTTPIQHLIQDNMPAKSVNVNTEFSHYVEWAETCNNLKGEEAQKQAQYLFNINYSIHFHTFTSNSLLGFINWCNEYLHNFEIELFAKCGIEIIVILKKI